MGKNVKVIIENENMLIDRNVVAKVISAMVHPLRNAIDHGIEIAQERGSKAIFGCITLAAQCSADQWILSLKDDGKGVDLDAVCERALDKGLIDAASLAKFDAQKKLELVLSGEISTAQKISEISGRGVGVAAYRDAVLNAGGKLELINNPG